MIPLAPGLVLGATGAVAGSFVSTAALRTAGDEQVLAGRSRCDGCARALGWVETLPLISYAAGAGRCGACGARIHPAHPASEAAGAITAVLLGCVIAWPAAILMVVMGAALTAAAAIDLGTQRLPDPLTLLVAICAATLAAQHGLNDLLVGAAAAGAAALILMLVRRAFRRLRGDPSLGLGDVKLIAALALWLGALTPLMVALAALAGLVIQVISRRNRIAFGPALAASGWVLGLLMEAGLWPG